MSKTKFNRWQEPKSSRPEEQEEAALTVEESDSQGSFEVEETTSLTTYTEPETVATETITTDLAQVTEKSHIRLLSNYGGRRTNEQRIAPGVYAVDDPALFGLAEYLIANGYAVWIEAVG